MEKAKILIVEDESIIAMHLESSLVSMGHTVTGIALSGEEAITKAERTRPDLVLMDIKLHGPMDGIEASEKIKSLYKIPVIFLTAYSDDETLERAKLSGPSAFILKPFDKRELQIVIELAIYKDKTSTMVERSYEELERMVQARTRELLLLQKQNEMILNSAGDGIFGLDGEGKVVFMNPSARRMMGHDAINILEKMALKAMEGKKQEENFFRDSVGGIFSPLVDGHTHLSDDMVFLRSDGTSFVIEYTSTPIRDGGKGPSGDDEKSQILGCVVIFRDVSERKQAADDLKTLAKHLKVSNQELEYCLQTTFKNVQGPIKSIINYTRLLNREYRGKFETDGQELVQSIIHGGKKLKKLINGVMTYSRMDKEKHNFERIDCNHIMEKIIGQMGNLIERTNAKITYEKLPVIVGNKVLLGEVFRNLLSNAIKFHREETPMVHISVERWDEWIFSVKDNGIGFDEKFSEKLFRLFERFNPQESLPGNGIGLAICKKIIEYHGGRIWAESVPGEGAQFFFTLPLERSPGE